MRWRADDGDFAVLAGITDEGEEVTVVGPLAHVHEGEMVDIAGEWRRHPRHGLQLQAERVRVREPVGETALLAYLASVKHVGPQGASWLLERHGPEAKGAVQVSSIGDGGVASRTDPRTAPERTTPAMLAKDRSAHMGHALRYRAGSGRAHRPSRPRAVPPR